MKIVEFANNIDPDEATHYEMSHLDIGHWCMLFAL